MQIVDFDARVATKIFEAAEHIACLVIFQKVFNY